MIDSDGHSTGLVCVSTLLVFLDIRQCLLPSVHNTGKNVDAFGRCFRDRGVYNVPFLLIFIAAEYSFKIRLLKNWTDDLKDKNSDAFKDLKTRLEEEVM